MDPGFCNVQRYVLPPHWHRPPENRDEQRVQSSMEIQDTGLSEIQMQEASIADRCPLEQTWDEADEDALVARIRGISARASMDTASEIELRRQDEALLRESEAVVARALHIPGERKMLMKLDDQLEKFMGNNELQHIKCVRCIRNRIRIITCQCHDPPSTQTHSLPCLQTQD